MTASRFWVGVEFMPASFVQAAASHPRPILCGQIAEVAAMTMVGNVLLNLDELINKP